MKMTKIVFFIFSIDYHFTLSHLCQASTLAWRKLPTERFVLRKFYQNKAAAEIFFFITFSQRQLRLVFCEIIILIQLCISITIIRPQLLILSDSERVRVCQKSTNEQNHPERMIWSWDPSPVCPSSWTSPQFIQGEFFHWSRPEKF